MGRENVIRPCFQAAKKIEEDDDDRRTVKSESDASRRMSLPRREHDIDHKKGKDNYRASEYNEKTCGKFHGLRPFLVFTEFLRRVSFSLPD
jgi:hypothetical protein